MKPVRCRRLLAIERGRAVHTGEARLRLGAAGTAGAAMRYRTGLAVIHTEMLQGALALGANESGVLDETGFRRLTAAAVVMDDRLVSQIRSTAVVAGLECQQAVRPAAVAGMNAHEVASPQQVQKRQPSQFRSFRRCGT